VDLRFVEPLLRAKHRLRRSSEGNMAGRIEARMKELGIAMPEAAPPRVAKIEGCVRWGDLLFVSGAVPKWNGEVRFVGKVGREFALAEAQAAARLSALNMLAQAKVALDGDLDRIRRTDGSSRTRDAPAPPSTPAPWSRRR
jgi:hypothetical protein